MRRSSRRLLILLAAVPALLFSFALLYQLGMEHLEDKPRGFGDSVEFVSETLTTTGYGADSHWDHGLMKVLVVLLQFSGYALTILVFPVFVVPYIEERFEARLPDRMPDLEGGVLVYGWGPAVEPLVERLEHLEVPVVVLEEDLGLARRLHDRGHVVVHTQHDAEDLDLSGLVNARGLVAAGDDPANAVVVLTARQQGFTGPIAALISTPARRSALQRIGATAVFTPGHILAAAVAARASEKISPRVSGAHSLGRHVQIAEVRLDRTSPLVGKTLAESRLRDQTGTTIVGWWKDGELRPPPGATERLPQGAILVAAGPESGIARLGKLATPVAQHGPVVVIGHDEVATKVAEFLDGVGEEVRRVSSMPIGSALVGDPLDPAVLEQAGVREARAVIVAMETDAETLFVSSLVRELAVEATVVAAARRAENVGRIRRAGADFALSVGQVAGQLLAYQLLGEEMVTLEAEIKLVRAAAGDLAGKPLASARVRERTGCSVVAIERGDDVIAEIGADFEVKDRDAVYVTGSSACIDRFFGAFPACRGDT